MELSNYKIKVTTEAESEEAQEFFFKLGFEWNGAVVKGSLAKARLIYGEDGVLWCGNCSDDFAECNFQELTLPQLRDLVVLHRNDVGDANYIGKYCGDFYVTSDGIIYGFNDDVWGKDGLNTMDTIKPINKELISGADALRALADGEDVEYSYVGDWLVVDLKTELGIFHRTDVAFRLKPSTITLNIEIPAPFEPTECEEFYVLSSIQPSGYIKTHVKKQAFLGAWKSEHDIQKVVAALSGALKNG